MKRSLIRASTLLALAALLVSTLPALAYAGVSEYQVQFAPVDPSGSGAFIVNVILSPETTLPARVRVPMPTGARLLWAGEIIGGDTANDLSREASVTAVADGLVVEFTLEKVRVAQVEAQWNAPTFSGSTVSSNLEWVNTTEAGTYTFAIMLPAGASKVKITPAVEGSPNTNANGETLRTLTPIRLEKGAKFPISVSYKTGGGGSAGGMSPILMGAIALLVIAIIALVAVLTRQGAGRGASSDTRSAPEERDSDPSSAAGATESDNDSFTWE